MYHIIGIQLGLSCKSRQIAIQSSYQRIVSDEKATSSMCSAVKNPEYLSCKTIVPSSLLKLPIRLVPLAKKKIFALQEAVYLDLSNVLFAKPWYKPVCVPEYVCVSDAHSAVERFLVCHLTLLILSS